MTVGLIDKIRELIEERRVKTGGFANGADGSFRADATCWGILALRAVGAMDLVRQARQALASAQHADGRVCISRRHKKAFWPTPLAILAWQGAPEYAKARQRAIQLLLTFDQTLNLEDTEGVIGHDPTIKGWPWIAQTHPWLEPTAYGLMALRLAALEGHDRTREAQCLVLDRQLAAGGWNYGNTVVYGQQLRPMPETTGIALQAIAGLVPRGQVVRSIDYLRSQLPSLRTPLALSWAILGLAAWREAEDGRGHITRIQERPDGFAAWDTVSLSLLVLAWHCENGLLDWLQSSGQETPS